MRKSENRCKTYRFLWLAKFLVWSLPKNFEAFEIYCHYLRRRNCHGCKKTPLICQRTFANAILGCSEAIKLTWCIEIVGDLSTNHFQRWCCNVYSLVYVHTWVEMWKTRTLVNKRLHFLFYLICNGKLSFSID